MKQLDAYSIEQAFTALARAYRDAQDTKQLCLEILRECDDAETQVNKLKAERRLEICKAGVNRLVLLAYRMGANSEDVNDYKAKCTSKWDLMDAGMQASEKVSLDTKAALAIRAHYARRTRDQIALEYKAKAERLGLHKKRFYRVLDVLIALGSKRDTRDLNTSEREVIIKMWAISPSKVTNNLWYAAKQKRVAAKLARKEAGK